MKFSIIIPVYNCEEYIQRCIQSITKQNYKDLEIIIINDGSTDNTLEICEKEAKKDKRIKLITQKNQGVSEARNNGIKNSTGDYIHFIDADDIIEANIYHFLNQELQKEKYDVIRFSYKLEKKGELFENNEEKITGEFYSNDIKEKIIPKALSEKIKLYVWQVIIKKDKIVYFDKKLKILEDFNFLLEILARAKKMKVIENSFYVYNISNENSATKSYEKYSIMMKNMLESNSIIKKTLEHSKIATKKNLKILDSTMSHSFCNYIELLYKKNHDYKESIKIFETVTKSKNLMEIFQYLDYNILPLKHKITTYLTLTKKYRILRIIYIIKEKLI